MSESYKVGDHELDQRSFELLNPDVPIEDWRPTSRNSDQCNKYLMKYLKENNYTGRFTCHPDKEFMTFKLGYQTKDDLLSISVDLESHADNSNMVKAFIMILDKVIDMEFKRRKLNE